EQVTHNHWVAGSSPAGSTDNQVFIFLFLFLAAGLNPRQDRILSPWALAFLEIADYFCLAVPNLHEIPFR
ncbi:MAG TPA: hypothetical protein VHW43_10385, partial [Puia sp.]|nr:hypothetical protein [Puia sp.]